MRSFAVIATMAMGAANAQTKAPTPSLAKYTVAPTHAPSVASSKPTFTLPPLVSSAVLAAGSGGCKVQADCYAKADTGMLTQLKQFNESLICDAGCSLGVSIDCNMFGLGQNCRSCFNTQAAADYYFNVQHPEQKGTGYIICPAGSVIVPNVTLPGTTSSRTNTTTSADRPVAGAGGCTTASDCYALASSSNLAYLTKFSKQLYCDNTCAVSGGLHCNEFGLAQSCRGCFTSQAAINSYYATFPDQIADKPQAIICSTGTTSADATRTNTTMTGTATMTNATMTGTTTKTNTTMAPTMTPTNSTKTNTTSTSGKRMLRAVPI